jgi:P pilus assembly chaperone PapD
MHTVLVTPRRWLMAVLLLLPTIVCAQGPGDLLIAPTRVVLDGRVRTAEIVLVNIGAATATYRISLVRQRMTEDGRFEEVGEPLEGEQFADDLVRFTPRQAVLEPRVAQTVRLQLRKPADLAAGEYRSHLLFRAIPPVAEATAEEAPTEGTLGIKLIPVYGISIPVIVRNGETWAKVTISDLELKPGTEDAPNPTLSLVLNRTGNRSTYGDITVTTRFAGQSKDTVLARVAGLAVYAPNPLRRLALALQVPDDANLSGARVQVEYRDRPEDGGALLAKGSLVAP